MLLVVISPILASIDKCMFCCHVVAVTGTLEKSDCRGVCVVGERFAWGDRLCMQDERDSDECCKGEEEDGWR